MERQVRTWQCPFYVRHSGAKVYCEGGCQIALPDRQSSDEFFDKYCAHIQGWKECSVAESKLDYYDRAYKKSKN